MKHCLSRLIHNIKTDTKTKRVDIEMWYYPFTPIDHHDQSYLGKVELVYSLELKATILT